jgi:hypothetical protein
LYRIFSEVGARALDSDTYIYVVAVLVASQGGVLHVSEKPSYCLGITSYHRQSVRTGLMWPDHSKFLVELTT